MSDNEDVRKAAQRLLKLFPVNRFFFPLQSYLKRTDITDEQFNKLNEAAMYFYYNRIIEASVAIDGSKFKAVNNRDMTRASA